MSLTVGSSVGPYEVIAPLGAGGMGEVYMPLHEALLHGKQKELGTGLVNG